MLKSPSIQLKKIYDELFAAYGPQKWWPGETPFEVIVGAILTQNTNWSNVEKAIHNLKRAKVLTPAAFKKISTARLAKLIRPSGYFNIKAKRLKNFIRFLFNEYDGSLEKMKAESLEILRKKLLAVNGIGPETADSILLYALDKTVFVVDTYTRRMLHHHGLIDKQADYHFIQKIFTDNLRNDRRIFNEYHALIVRAGRRQTPER